MTNLIAPPPKPPGEGWTLSGEAWLRHTGTRLSPIFPFYCGRFEVTSILDSTNISHGCKQPDWVPEFLKEGDMLPNPVLYVVSALGIYLAYKAIRF